MFNFINYADYYDKQSSLLSLDKYKTFDSFKWEFILKVFECYGFGDNFMRFLKTIYNTPKCCIIINNYMSSFFEVSTGVRQGDRSFIAHNACTICAVLSKCFEARCYIQWDCN